MYINNILFSFSESTRLSAIAWARDWPIMFSLWEKRPETLYLLPAKLCWTRNQTFAQICWQELPCILVYLQSYRVSWNGCHAACWKLPQCLRTRSMAAVCKILTNHSWASYWCMYGERGENLITCKGGDLFCSQLKPSRRDPSSWARPNSRSENRRDRR